MAQRHAGQDGRQQSLITELEGNAAERRARVVGALVGRGWRLDTAQNAARLVLYLDHCSDDERVSHAGKRAMCKHLALGWDTVKRYLRRLRDEGFMISTERYRENGSQASNATTINWDAFQPWRTTKRETTTDPPRRTDDTDRDLSSSVLPSSSVVSVPSVVTCSSVGVAPPRVQVAPPGGQYAPPLFPCISLDIETSSSVAAFNPWQDAEEELLKCGVKRAAETCRSLQRAGLDAAFVSAAIRYWQPRRQSWERAEGALYYRLLYAQSGQEADDPKFWPKPSDEWLEAQRRQAAEARRAAAVSAQAARQDAARAAEAEAAAAADELEARAGPALDNLAADELRALAKRALPDALWRRFLQVGPTGFVRGALLAEMDRESRGVSTTDSTDDTDKVLEIPDAREMPRARAGFGCGH